MYSRVDAQLPVPHRLPSRAWSISLEHKHFAMHARHRNMSSYVNNFTATLWCTRYLAQLKDANEGWVRTTARLLQKEHVVQVCGGDLENDGR